MKLQKILYYLQGHFIAQYDIPLFSDDIYAWKLGPVILAFYDYYRCYGVERLPHTGKNEELCLATKKIDFIDDQIERNLDMDVWDLVRKTHEEAPWIEATKNGTVFRELIPRESIKAYFKGIYS